MTYTYQINPETLGDTTPEGRTQFVAVCNRSAEFQELACRFELGDAHADAVNRGNLDDDQIEEGRWVSTMIWDSEWQDPERAVVNALEALEDLKLTDPGDLDLEKVGGLDRALTSARSIVEAFEALEDARAELEAHICSGGKATYLANDGNGEVEYEETTAEEAAKTYTEGGGWGDRTKTDWVTVRTRAKYLPDNEWESHTVTIEPEEPDCTHEDGHDWQSPHRILGGLKENPGVRGNGGGVIVNECCMRCGCRRTTNTWDQNRETGEQGLTSIEYEAECYADELEEDDE
jgi:hypothetical protein